MNNLKIKKKNYSIHSNIKRKKYLRINLTKEVQNLGNYKVLLKEIIDLNKWKNMHAHGL